MLLPRSCEHDWRETGRQVIHVEFPTKTEGWKRLFAIYVRCVGCGQIGFREPNRRVVYTWNPEDVLIDGV